jgi:WhiB family redox-sensing transcriptional regulator
MTPMSAFTAGPRPTRTAATTAVELPDRAAPERTARPDLVDLSELPDLVNLPDLADLPDLVDLVELADLPGLSDLPGLPGFPALAERSALGALDAEMRSPRRDWTAEASCKGRTNLFFGLAGERPERRARREDRARRVCEGCPALEPCRSWARHHGENGFWGGESEEQRAAAGYPPISISRRSVQEAAVVGVRLKGVATVREEADSETPERRARAS